MIRPARFGYNSQTQSTNVFQAESPLAFEEIQAQAAAEFDAAVRSLRSAGINVLVIDDTAKPAKPDAVFPNNWVSFHSDGTIILYPMLSTVRRMERRTDVVDTLRQNFTVGEIVDLTPHEIDGRFLEGTGSIVFDHRERIAYACLSSRTDASLLSLVCSRLGYTPFTFNAVDRSGRSIYHTNVMMCVSENFAVICLESIRTDDDRRAVIESLRSTGHEIVEISMEQMYDFAGNMLSLETSDGRTLLVLSQRAHKSLTQEQRQILNRESELLPLNVGTIETTGGGSVRCMIAEIFLPKL